MSELRTNRIVPKDGLSSGASGGIIQVKSTTKTDAASLTSSGTETLIPGMSVTITPTRADSKILIMFSLSCATGGSFAGQYIVLRRDSTSIARGDAAGSRQRGTAMLGAPATYDYDQDSYGPGLVSFTHLDSPASTSAITYGIFHADPSSSNALYVNRSINDSDSVAYIRTVSSITVMEITG
tara:strand:- start:2028 stop:2573 length:546 start_codon:yes stop_codon:yes gene_type:complete